MKARLPKSVITRARQYGAVGDGEFRRNYWEFPASETTSLVSVTYHPDTDTFCGWAGGGSLTAEWEQQ